LTGLAPHARCRLISLSEPRGPPVCVALPFAVKPVDRPVLSRARSDATIDTRPGTT
jgi:hypothetical protein